MSTGTFIYFGILYVVVPSYDIGVGGRFLASGSSKLIFVFLFKLKFLFAIAPNLESSEITNDYLEIG